MSNWYIGSPTGTAEGVYAAEDVLRSWPWECDDEGKDAAERFLRSRGRWKDGVVAAQPTDEMFIDGGGMAIVGEPKVGWEANGTKFKTFVRHLPFILEVLRDRKEDPNLPGCVFFGGAYRCHAIGIKTIRESVPIMERLLKGTESLRQEVEMRFQGVINGTNGGAFSARKCGCLSGLMYGDCCGKAVESEKAKELRKAAVSSIEQSTKEKP